MVGVGRLELCVPYVKALGNIQGQQRGYALTVGRTFPDRHAPIVRVDGFVPIGVVCCQVTCRDPASFGLNEIGDFLGDVASVKGVSSPFGNGLQRLSQGWQRDHLAVAWGVTSGQEFHPGWASRQLAFGGLPLAGDHLGHGVTVECIADCWAKHLTQAHHPVRLQRRLPAIHRPRYRNREGSIRPIEWDRTVPFPLHLFHVGRGCGPPTAV